MIGEERALAGEQLVRDLSPSSRLRLIGLTPRESEIALLVGRGFLVREIAEQIQVSEGTVKTLLARARAKLTCRNVRELSDILLGAGIVDPRDLVGPRQDEVDGK
ncbi:MAG TPA: helix-turn-helix transcriptional regulator [Chloroflexota bacterium]|nr:helix-turn-helix transcriptional regulator [Chloroflexota bacterium]